MKITTKTGDKGETGMFNGRRVSKASIEMEALGGLDELQALLGAARHVEGVDGALIVRIQDDVYRIMSVVGFGGKCPMTIEEVNEADVELLEEEMKKRKELFEDIKGFVRPGETKDDALMHLCRAVCRRAERCLVALREVHEETVSEEVLKYMNRLSDLLFVLGLEV